METSHYYTTLNHCGDDFKKKHPFMAHAPQRVLRSMALFALLLAFVPFIHAQSAGGIEIKGEVMDSISGSGDAYATVRLLSQDKKTVVAVAATDVNGKFTLAGKAAGTFLLQTQGLGRQSKLTPLTVPVGATSVDAGKILTKESAASLGEATVTAAAPLVTSQIDRLTYSMADDPDAQANTMIDMLRKVPLVTVDGQDNITINGRSDFKVYVNGKPNKMITDNASVVLKSFPASVVKKVEVITDPGAKYDAEGVSGILNIVTETDAQTSGYTFKPNIRLSTRDIGANAFFMTQIGKLTLSAFGGLSRQFTSKVTQENERLSYNDPTDHYLFSRGEGKNRMRPHYLDLEASYEFSPKDLLSVDASFFKGKQKSWGDVLTTMSDEAGNEVYSYQNSTLQPRDFMGINASVDYQHQFAKEDQNLTLSYRLSTNDEDTESTNEYFNLKNLPYSLQDLYMKTDGKTEEHTVQADFTTPFASHHTLSVGGKYIYRYNRSNNTEMTRVSESGNPFVKDDDLSLLYRHKNDIAAAYTEYIYKFNKFSLRAGVRFESSHIRVNYPGSSTHTPFSTRLNDWVPSINIGYNLQPTMMLRANYNMRIGRPSISYLSPYIDHTTPYSITYGSPNLTSETTHNFEINFSSFSQKFSLNTSLEYSVSSNGLTPYAFLDNGILNNTYGNFLHSKRLNLNVFMNMMLSPKTTFMLNGNMAYNDFKSYKTSDKNNGLDGRVFGMFRQELPAKVKLGLGGGHNWGNVSLQGKDGNFYFYFASLSRSFLKDDRLTVEINCVNVFTPKLSFKKTSETDTFFSRSNTSIRGISRVGIGVSWRFGQLNSSVKKTSKTITNDDVKAAESNNASSVGNSTGNMTGGMQ